MLIFSIASEALLSAVDCPSFDLKSHFGPIRDQADLGMCHAFAAAALAEEDFCLANKRNCGRYLSVYDLTSCEWRSGEGGKIEDDLQCYIDGGACLEKWAPYDQKADCGGMLSWFKRESPKCLRDQLRDYYELRKKSCSADARKEISEAALALNTIDRQHFGFDLNKTFRESPNVNVFVAKSLIPPACSEHRNKPPGPRQLRSVGIKSEDAKTFKSDAALRAKYHELFIREIKDNLARNRSSALSIRLAALPIDRDNLKLAMVPPNAGHAIVVNGMRYNIEKKRCEVQLRNSWGETTALTGWKDIEDILPAVKKISSLR